MELDKTFNFIRNTNGQLQYGPIDEYVNTNSANVWKGCECNILTFLNELTSESKKKFLNWMTQYGLTDIEDVRKAYITASLVLKKIKEISPPEIKQCWNTNKNGNIITFICYHGCAEKVLEWAKTVITEEELLNAKEICLSDNAPSHPPPPSRPARAPARPTPGYTATRISSVSSAHPSQKFGMLANRNVQEQQGIMSGVRSLDELKRVFGEK
jgi:hypothetical protein